MLELDTELNVLPQRFWAALFSALRGDHSGGSKNE